MEGTNEVRSSAGKAPEFRQEKGKEREIPVMIDMASLISYRGMPDDPLHLMTTGTLITRGNHALLQYREALEDDPSAGGEGDEVQLVLRKDQVTMNRRGRYANTMLFQRNKRFETVYQTPFGDLPMAVIARDVRCDLKRESGKVHLRYEISMQGSYTSTNELHLEFWAT